MMRAGSTGNSQRLQKIDVKARGKTAEGAIVSPEDKKAFEVRERRAVKLFRERATAENGCNIKMEVCTQAHHNHIHTGGPSTPPEHWDSEGKPDEVEQRLFVSAEQH